MSAKTTPLKPRKSPRQERAAETVAIILEAAACILERDGFAGYNTNAIAERAGVSIGSLYQYFPGKEALTIALIERETATLLADLTGIAAAASWEDGLRRLITASVAHQMRRPALARLLDFEEQRLPVDERDELVSGRITHDLADLLKRRDAVSANHEVIAGDLKAIIRGMVDAAGERSESDPVALQRRVEAAVFGYLDRSAR